MGHAKSLTLAAVTVAALAATVFIPMSAQASDVLLSGSITSAAGEKLAGVTVSAKAERATITTTVFTDEGGDYYFPPLPAGRYRVWAQALTFATAKEEVDLGASKRQDFKLTTLADFERQLPGDLVIASLPDETPDDARLKSLVRNNCTGCHTPDYALQHKFDAAGWSTIIDLMKRFNISGGLDSDRVNGVLEFNQKELAAYLARARGPGDTSMKFKLRPRPTGEAARVVYKEYDVPVQADANMPAKYQLNDGSDWSQGTPSRIGSLVHDSWADLDGNIWFTSNVPDHHASLTRIDAQTGAVKTFKVPGRNGLAANTHGMTRDPNGIIWFNVNPGKGSLGRLDPKTEQVKVFQPPDGMAGGGCTTVDFDGKGRIWVSSAEGVLHFDPVTETFTEYKSLTYRTPNGTGTTCGVAGDREGNGWWAEMTLDIIGHADSKTGQASEIKLPPVALDKNLVSDEQRAFYEKFAQADFNQPVPWNEGPRRMGSDKNGDVLWVGNSWGGSLAKIDIHTMEASFVPLPGPGVMQPYHVAVDSGHNAWLNIWTSDVIMRFDPATNKWTTFDLPTRGTEARHISLLERDGKMEVVLPYSRTSKVAVMTFRSEADLQALKAQAGQ
jgi:virginiamycin B lyase